MKQSILNTLATLCLAVAFTTLSGTATAQIDRSQAPAPGPQPEIAIGDYTLHTLNNGLKLIVVENHRLPRISWSLTLDFDPPVEGDKAGVASFAGQLMKTGTEIRSKAQIDEAVDFIGARLSTGSQGAFASSLTKHADTVLSLMADVVLNPTFPEDELEKLRAQTLSNLAANETDPGSISSNLRRRVMYGAEHPYGDVETEESISSLTQEDLKAYHETYFRPNVGYLVVVGDITSDEALAKVTERFGPIKWKSREVPNPVVPIPLRPEGNQVVFANVPGAVQSVLHLVHTVRLQPGHNDVIPVSVMNSILGGGAFSGRLMQNLREDKAFTYGARCNTSPDDLIGSFDAYANVRNEVTDSSVVEFLYEIKRITEEPVDAETVQNTISYMTGSFARSLERPETIARFALNIERYGLAKDYYRTYLERLAAVTPDDIMRVAKTYLRPEQLHITVAGNRSEVADKLVAFDADGEIDFYDAYGRRESNLQAAPEGMTAASVIEAYYEARGGLARFEKMKSLIEIGSMEAGPGMTLDVKTQTIFGEGMNTEISMAGNVMMGQTVTPEFGFNNQQGTELPMSEDELATYQSALYATEYAHLNDMGYEAELMGIHPNRGQPVYIVEVRKEDATTKELHFDVESGLLIRINRAQQSPMGTLQITETLEDYKDFDGLLFPTVQTQTANGQQMSFVMSDIQPNAKVDGELFKR